MKQVHSVLQLIPMLRRCPTRVAERLWPIAKGHPAPKEVQVSLFGPKYVLRASSKSLQSKIAPCYESRVCESTAFWSAYRDRVTPRDTCLRSESFFENLEKSAQFWII